MDTGFGYFAVYVCTTVVVQDRFLATSETKPTEDGRRRWVNREIFRLRIGAVPRLMALILMVPGWM